MKTPLICTEDKATLAAEALKEQFVIGKWSKYCDECDFDSAETEEIAVIIRKIYENPTI